MVGVADVRGVPGFLRGRVKRVFREGLPHPVLLDWDGGVLGELGPKPGGPNVYLVGCDGRVLLGVAGEVSESKLNQVARAIAVLRARAD